MARCGCSSQCSCSVVGSNGVTVTGTGAPGNPYVVSADSGGNLQVTDTPSVDLTLLGSGTAADPHILSATARISTSAQKNLLTQEPDGLAVTCESVQDCVGEALADGLEYDDAGNTIRVRVSGQAGNSVSIGPDGGVYAPVGGGNPVTTGDTACISLDGDGAGTPLTASPVMDAGAGNLLQCVAGGLRAQITTGCGLAGDGSDAAPLVAATRPWPFPSDLTGTAGGVYCDSNGELRSDPPARMRFFENTANITGLNVLIPDAVTDAGEATVTVTNPDPARPAQVLVWCEADIDINLPGGAAASMRLGNDEYVRWQNEGTTLRFGYHVQVMRTETPAPVPAGGTATIRVPMAVARGSGGAYYSRVQWRIVAALISLQP